MLYAPCPMLIYWLLNSDFFKVVLCPWWLVENTVAVVKSYQIRLG